MWKSKRFALAGGMDVISPPAMQKPGYLLAAENFLAKIEGGYQRVNGCEAYDGRIQNAVPVPGSGVIRGLFVYRSELYAWRNDEAGTRLRMYKSTAAGWVEVGASVTLPANGDVQACAFAFNGAAGAMRLYFITGTNAKAYQWDGATLTEISGIAGNPIAIAAHQNRLWVASAGSVQGSAMGAPTNFASGAVEFGQGDTVVCLQPWRDDALLIGCKGRVNMLVGASTASFALKTVTQSTGADRMIEVGGEMVALWQTGANSIQAVQQFGDAQSVSLMATVKPQWRGVTRAASKVNEGYGVIQDNPKGGWLLSYQAGAAPMWTRWAMPWNVSALHADDVGVYYGLEDGRVMRQRDELTSFAGEAIPAYFRLVFTDLGASNVKKRLYRLALQVSSQAPVQFQYVIDGDDVLQNSEAGALLTSEAGELRNPGAAGLYGSAEWENFVWGVSLVQEEYAPIAGVGRLFSLLLRSDSATARQFSVMAAEYQFNYWGARR